jgi:hypothetical protein
MLQWLGLIKTKRSPATVDHAHGCVTEGVGGKVLEELRVAEIHATMASIEDEDHQKEQQKAVRIEALKRRFAEASKIRFQAATDSATTSSAADSVPASSAGAVSTPHSACGSSCRTTPADAVVSTPCRSPRLLPTAGSGTGDDLMSPIAPVYLLADDEGPSSTETYFMSVNRSFKILVVLCVGIKDKDGLPLLDSESEVWKRERECLAM